METKSEPEEPITSDDASIGTPGGPAGEQGEAPPGIHKSPNLESTASWIAGHHKMVLTGSFALGVFLGVLLRRG